MRKFLSPLFSSVLWAVPYSLKTQVSTTSFYVRECLEGKIMFFPQSYIWFRTNRVVIHNQQLLLFCPARHQWLTREKHVQNKTRITRDLSFFLRPVTSRMQMHGWDTVIWPLRFVLPSVGLRTINCRRPWRLCLCPKWVVSYAARKMLKMLKRKFTTVCGMAKTIILRARFVVKTKFYRTNF